MSPVEAAMPDPKMSRAVLIGVSDYRSGMRSLPAVANNVNDLAALLKDAAVWGLPERNCEVVLNPKDGREILDAIDRAATATSGTLLVYYAGHGLRGPSGDLRLVPPDADQKKLQFTVRFDDIRDMLLATEVRASGKVVILDCCYSGAADMGPADMIDEVAGRTAIAGTYVMTATTESRRAMAPLGARYTAFTGALLEAIRSGVRAGPPVLNMETLFHQVAERIGSRGEPTPEQRSRGDGHRLAIARNRWTPPPEPGAGGPSTRVSRVRRRAVIAVLASVAVISTVAALMWHPWHTDDSPRPPAASTGPVHLLSAGLNSASTEERRTAVAALGSLARGDAANRPAACTALRDFVTHRLPYPQVEPYDDPRLPALGYRAQDVQDAVTLLGGVPCPAVDLTEIDLRVSQLAGDFRTDDLSWSMLYRADVTKAHFESAKFIGAHLWNVNAKRTSFEGADFDGAEFTRASLPGANLRNASFRPLTDRRTLFYYTDLTAADLRGAHLQGADLHLAKIDATTQFAGAEADHETLWPPKFDWRKAGVRQHG